MYFIIWHKFLTAMAVQSPTSSKHGGDEYKYEN